MYTLVGVQWDEAKRLATIEQRGLDFVNARRLFDGRATVTVSSDTPFESRFVTIAMLEDSKFYSVIWT